MTAPRPRPVWCPHDTRKLTEDAARVEPKPRLREWLWAPLAIAAAILSGLITAPHARADGQTADIINASVLVYCDQYFPLLQAIGSKARAGDSKGMTV